MSTAFGGKRLPGASREVRIRSVGATSVEYDSAARSITLYPGNVANLNWTAQSLLTLFGQAVRPDGSPIRDAAVQSQRGIGETDDRGYFQIDVAGADTLSFTTGQAPPCHVAVPAARHDKELLSLGKVICR